MGTEELKSEQRKLEDAKLMKENLKDAQMPSVERSIVSHSLLPDYATPLGRQITNNVNYIELIFGVF